jgi:uroporphyrinogen-III synthase
LSDGTSDVEAGALAGLRVVAFESRRAGEIARMLGRHGAEVIGAPALREVPLEDNTAALDLLPALERGEIDALVLLTGVGTRALLAVLETRCPREEIVARLARLAIVARGPKPVAALREAGLKATVTVPEPNTWREILASLDRELPVRGRRIAVQEYGRPSPELLAGLAARGAEVRRVPVYGWALPADLGPLRSAIDRMLSGDADVAVFTTAVQLDHLLAVAAETGREKAVIEALRERVVVAAIGPTARAALESRAIRVDIEPEHPKLGHLVAALASAGRDAVARKHRRG